jgi:hypothetical protein
MTPEFWQPSWPQKTNFWVQDYLFPYLYNFFNVETLSGSMQLHSAWFQLPVRLSKASEMFLIADYDYKTSRQLGRNI